MASPEQAWRDRRSVIPLWRERLQVTDKGIYRATLHNCVVALSEHEAWTGVLAFDDFANRIVMRRPPPYGGEAGAWTDRDAVQTAAWLGNPEHDLGIPVKSSMAMEAALVVAARQRFHPVRDYLDGLAWDGEERITRLLSDYFGARHDEYSQAVAVNWLVSAVARTYKPGCKVDNMLVLEGPQGLGKTRAVRELAGNAWYAEAMESPTAKDFYQSLSGKWIVEIAEMHSFSKAEVTKVKQALSAQEDTYRPSYGRVSQSFPRQCVFVGTTNDDTYLRDPTGARRFWPVRCSDINVSGLASIRDQLWAEAVQRFRDGHAWWRVPAQAHEEQEERFDEDSWTDPVRAWCAGDAPLEAYPPHHVGPVTECTITEVLRSALKVELAKHGKPEQMRVGAILRRLGYLRERRQQGGERGYVFRFHGDWPA